MDFKIGGKVQELTFGVGFVRKLDKKYQIQKEGLEFGLGLTLVYPQLENKSVTALSDVIRCALPTSYSELAVDNAIDEYAEEHQGLAELYENVKEGLATSYVTSETVQQIKDDTETELKKSK